jgi:hypothetical protein
MTDNPATNILRTQDRPIFMTVAKMILAENHDFDKATLERFEESFERRLNYYMNQLISKYESEMDAQGSQITQRGYSDAM